LGVPAAQLRAWLRERRVAGYQTPGGRYLLDASTVEHVLTKIAPAVDQEGAS
jgi:hypothetical protein